MLSIKNENNIAIARIENTDKITAVNAEDIKEELNNLLKGKHKKLVLNLENIDFIDSSGFACFLSAMKTANDNYGCFKVFNINEEVLRIFKLLHLDTIFETFDSKDDCLNSF
jgi:anti-anti-sigma factor